MIDSKLADMICIIDLQLESNKAVYQKYQLKSEEDLGSELWESINRLGDVSIALMRIREILVTQLREEYGVFML